MMGWRGRGVLGNLKEARGWWRVKWFCERGSGWSIYRRLSRSLWLVRGFNVVYRFFVLAKIV